MWNTRHKISVDIYGSVNGRNSEVEVRAHIAVWVRASFITVVQTGPRWVTLIVTFGTVRVDGHLGQSAVLASLGTVPTTNIVIRDHMQWLYHRHAASDE